MNLNVIALSLLEGFYGLIPVQGDYIIILVEELNCQKYMCIWVQLLECVSHVWLAHCYELPGLSPLSRCLLPAVSIK